jgi:hypothetical protein
LISLAVNVEIVNALLLPIVLGFLLALEIRRAAARPADARLAPRHNVDRVPCRDRLRPLSDPRHRRPVTLPGGRRSVGQRHGGR